MTNHTFPHPQINKIAADFNYIKFILLRKGVITGRLVIEADIWKTWKYPGD
jgi:hypothetical protein